MKTYIKNIIPAAALFLAVGLDSCTKDLDVTPIDPNLETNIQPEALFNKCYANIAVAGNGGANGDCDVDGIDGGTSGFVRQMWNANELTTDESICGWGDEGIANFCYNTYDASHPMLRGYYYRLYTGISFCNQYLQEFGDKDATMTAEVRFIRAFDYFLLLDGWGNVPFVTGITSDKPAQYSRSDMFNFIESELLEIEPQLSAAVAKKSSDPNYGRVDKAAAWMLLARLYLNAEVYTGTARYDKASQYAEQVMNSSYKLNRDGVGSWSAYQMLFMADNGETSAAYEAIFPILQDGVRTTSWGTTLFLIASTHDADMADCNGTTEAWGGNRARPELIAKWFPKGDAPAELSPKDFAKAAGDDRAIIDSRGRIIDNVDVSAFKNGYAVAKFNNYTSSGAATSSSQFPDGDFFMLRAAEAYLTYAEAQARIGGGTAQNAAAAAINQLRLRANATTKDSYTLDEICDEWCREFYYEGRRRMDLIRFGKFGGSSDYTWQWKGGSYAGRNFESYKNLFAIPSTDLNANPNLVQNPGYAN
jgi:hypothetical protein